MKRCLYIISFITLLGITFTSCNRERLTPNEEIEYNYVTFNPIINSSVEISDEPLSKAGDAVTPSVYLALIHQYNENTAKYESYAYSILSSMEGASLKVNVKGRYKITMQAFSVPELLSEYSFRANGGFTDISDYTDGYVYDNNFSFSFNNFSKKGVGSYSFYLLEGDGYQNEAMEFEGSATSVDVTLNRYSAGFDYTVIGLEEGEVKIEIRDNSSPLGCNQLEYRLTKESSSISKILIGNYKGYASSLGFTISATYIAPDGVETLLSSQELKLEALKRTIYKLSIKKEDTDNGDTAFKVSLNHSDIVDGETIENDVTI